jgi:hypothetical protein
MCPRRNNTPGVRGVHRLPPSRCRSNRPDANYERGCTVRDIAPRLWIRFNIAPLLHNRMPRVVSGLATQGPPDILGRRFCVFGAPEGYTNAWYALDAEDKVLWFPISYKKNDGLVFMIRAKSNVDLFLKQAARSSRIRRPSTTMIPQFSPNWRKGEGNVCGWSLRTRTTLYSIARLFFIF